MCAELDYIVDAGRELQCEYVMSNNFAFGGINTSLIFDDALRRPAKICNETISHF